MYVAHCYHHHYHYYYHAEVATPPRSDRKTLLGRGEALELHGAELLVFKHVHCMCWFV